jgi:lambda family phage minor tail protein L
VSSSVLREAQKLETDPLVELWELDTTALTNVLGVLGTGAVYRWTPGQLNYRQTGVCGPGSLTTALVLDRVVTYANSALNYTMQVDLGGGQFSDPILVAGWAVANGVSLAGLVTPLPSAPAAGATWLLESVGTVKMGGVVYNPMPIELSAMEWSGQGKLPRPTLRISNIGGLITALVAEFGDIVGATVTRRMTFKSFLDGEATPDPSALFEPDIFTVDRKSAHNKTYIEFELAPAMDQQGIALPKRLVLRDSCDHTYRQWTTIGGGGHFVYGTCPYTDESRWYKADGTSALQPQDDLCGKRLADCLLRFRNGEWLPFRGFPGAAEVKV